MRPSLTAIGYARATTASYFNRNTLLPYTAPHAGAYRRSIMTNSKVMGPVDYLLIKFPGNKFTGKIAPELARLQKEGLIRVLDLVFMVKDEQGKLAILEAANLQGEVGAAFNELSKNTYDWFSEGDIEAIGESLPNNSSAGLLLFENVWAAQFKEYLLEADAELIAMERVPPENVEKVGKTVTPKGGA
jgi:uncharacterized membrane protein